MELIKKYQDIFCGKFNSLKFLKDPPELYEPIDYALSAGGKRIRPVLTVMICDFFGNNFEDALNPAIAIEIFHNFTLVHDDIMDDAPIRRGKSTVYKKYDINTAILSGDTMFAKAYEFVTLTREDKLPAVLKVFTKTAMEVCEGQQYDMNFETQQDVSLEEYLLMIKLKTAVLMGASLKIGAIMGGANEEQSSLIFEFGEEVGMVFQLQDDLLDTFGDESTFGKRVGGDILDCKKTYLYVKAMEKLSTEKSELLLKVYHDKNMSEDLKISKVQELFREAGVIEDCKVLMNKHHVNSMKALESINLKPEYKQVLSNFAESLLVRDF
ncbi:MAG: polyprenyl synthetase [Marinilabiliales bacterium]|nr:MAG: polyprenyl synthetase [Marinilabiliales bacterium]